MMRLTIHSGVIFRPSSRKTTSTGVTSAVKRRQKTIQRSHLPDHLLLRGSMMHPCCCISVIRTGSMKSPMVLSNELFPASAPVAVILFCGVCFHVESLLSSLDGTMGLMTVR